MVVIACVLAAVAAHSLMGGLSPFAKAAMTAFAGGGVLAMTLNNVIPEAYEEVNDQISILGGIGFAVAFIVSHLFSH
jgi:ZIP family zinc transporter